MNVQKQSLCHFRASFRVNQELLVLLGSRVFQDAMAQRYKPSWVFCRSRLAMLHNVQNCFKFPPIYNFYLFSFVTLSARKTCVMGPEKEKVLLFVQNKYLNNIFLWPLLKDKNNIWYFERCFFPIKSRRPNQFLFNISFWCNVLYRR